MPCYLAKDPAFKKIITIEAWRELFPGLDDLDRRYEIVQRKHEREDKICQLVKERLAHVSSFKEFVLGLLGLYHEGLLGWSDVRDISQLPDEELDKYNDSYLAPE